MMLNISYMDIACLDFVGHKKVLLALVYMQPKRCSSGRYLPQMHRQSSSS